EAFLASVGRPASQVRIKALMEHGFHKAGDVENRRGTMWVSSVADISRSHPDYRRRDCCPRPAWEVFFPTPSKLGKSKRTFLVYYATRITQPSKVCNFRNESSLQSLLL